VTRIVDGRVPGELCPNFLSRPSGRNVDRPGPARRWLRAGQPYGAATTLCRAGPRPRTQSASRRESHRCCCSSEAQASEFVIWDARSSRTPGEWRRPAGHLWLAPDASRLAHPHEAMPSATPLAGRRR
jgi:hypothetical protein